MEKQIVYVYTEQAWYGEQDDYGKIIVIVCSGSEDAILEKLYTVLKEGELIQEEVWEKSNVLSYPDLEIFLKERNVYCNGQKVYCNHLEFLTLAYLAARPNWVFTKKQIYEAVWKEPGEFCGSAVANVISQIRRKLRKAGVKKEYIQTVIHQGYKFVP